MEDMQTLHAVHDQRGDRPRLNLRALCEEHGVEIIVLAEGGKIAEIPDAVTPGHSPHAQYALQQGNKVVAVPFGTDLDRPDKSTLYGVSHELARAVSMPDANLEQVLAHQNNSLVDWLSRVFG